MRLVYVSQVCTFLEIFLEFVINATLRIWNVFMLVNPSI